MNEDTKAKIVQEWAENNMVCAVDNRHGIYVPQIWAKRFGEIAKGVSKEDIDILLAGPEHEHYWETWDDVLENARVNSATFYLSENGDVFIVYSDPTEDLAMDDAWDYIA